MNAEILSYYAQPGALTGAGPYAAELCTLPPARAGLVNAVQGLNVHIFWAERYGLDLDDNRQAEVQLRPLTARLARLLELDGSPLTVSRAPERRLVSNCRDFSLFSTGVLRAFGIPARARCGFGTYFLPGHYEDHWVVESWDAEQTRWVWFDPQIDDLMRQALKITWDTLDMPPGQFITGGQAWLMCRREGANPDDFGIFEFHGWDFIRGNLARDLLALNKLEVLPWDFWGLLAGKPVVELDETELARLDDLALLTLDPDTHFTALRLAYDTSPDLHVPQEWLTN